MSLVHINQFATEDKDKLSRQLSDLEDNVSAELDSVRAAGVPLPTVRTFTASASRGIVALGPDQQLSVDTFIANASVVLPALDPNNFGRRFTLIKRVAGNSILVSCRDSAALCNGGAFPTVTAVGVTVFYCDASGYYK